MRKVTWSAAALILAILVMPGAVPGQDITTFSDGKEPPVVTVDGPRMSQVVEMELPADAYYSRAGMDFEVCSADWQNFSDPASVRVSFDNETLYSFGGKGLGRLGTQDVFADGRGERTFHTGEAGGTFSANIRLPKKANVYGARIDVEVEGNEPGWTKRCIYGEGAGSYFGYAMDGVGDVNGDGYDDFLVGAPYYSQPERNCGRAYLYYGGPQFDGEPDLVIAGTERLEKLGYSVSAAGDFNGDGFDDFIIGAPRDDWHLYGEYPKGKGKALLFYGGPALDGSPDMVLYAPSESTGFGVSVAGGGDLNGDGFDDVVVCMPYLTQAWRSGATFIYFGGRTPDDWSDIAIHSPQTDTYPLGVESVGDVNGDGYDDSLVLYNHYNYSYLDCNHAGPPNLYAKALLYLGGPHMDNVSDALFEGGKNRPVNAFSGAGDLNADGQSDLLLTDVWNPIGGNLAGVASIYLGAEAVDNVTDLVFQWGYAQRGLGTDASSAGDVNGDGFDDAILGMCYGPLGGLTTRGAACVLYGGAELDAEPDIVLDGTRPGDFFGGVVSGAGDVNGDGRDEFLVAAVGDDTADTNAGMVCLYSLGSGILEPRLFLNGSTIWEQKGLVAHDARSRDFSTQLNAYLKKTPAIGSDAFGNDYVDFPIYVSAKSKGNITLRDMRIVYSYTCQIPDFLPQLRKYISTHKVPGSRNVTVPIVFEADTPTIFYIEKMLVSCDLAPNMSQPIPNVIIPEDTWCWRLLDLWKYFGDDSQLECTMDYALCRTTDGDPVKVSLCANRYLSADALTGEANDNWTGVIRLKVACSDCSGSTTFSNEFSIIIANVDDPPVITSTPAPNATAGEEYLYKLDAVDGDGEALTFSLLDGPAGMGLDCRTGELRWRPDARGVFAVSVGVRDLNNSMVQNFTLSVWKNTPPRMVTAPSENLTVGQLYIYEFKAVDDECDRFKYELLTKPPGVIFDAGARRLYWTPTRSQVGHYTMNITVNDTHGASSVQEWKVQVVDRPPMVTIDHHNGRNWPMDNGAALMVWGSATPGALGLQRVEVRLDGGEWEVANGTFHWDYRSDASKLMAGDHTIEARSFDGEYSETVTMNFFLDPDGAAEESSGLVALMPPVAASLFLVLALAGASFVRKGRRGRALPNGANN